jgi:preprotein translocase subunit YajC
MLSSFFIPAAFAVENATPTQVSPMGGLEQILLLGGFIVVFYLIIWRPQSKRTKAHKQLLSSLSVGDEVVAAGGLLGKVSKMTEQFVVLKIADNQEITVQKHVVSLILPKDTLKTI